MRLREDHATPKVAERPAPKFRNQSAGKPTPVRARQAPKPKPKPTFMGSHADPSSPQFHATALRLQALDQARHANDAAVIRRQLADSNAPDSNYLDSVIGTLRGTWNRPTTEYGLNMGTRLQWKFFNQPGRPAPAKAKADFESKVGKSVLTDDQAMQLYGGNVANADAFDQATADIRAKKGYTGIDIIDVPQMRGKKARDKLLKDPYYQWLTEKNAQTTASGAPSRAVNALTVNSMGLPLRNQAIEQYTKDAADILAAGAQPQDVPGLVLGPDQIASVIDLKRQVIAKGYSEAQANNMNFGQLVAAARTPKQSKYYLGRVLNNTPRSISRGLINFPMGAAIGVRALQEDVQNYAHGRQGLAPDLHYAHPFGVPVPIGTPQFGKTAVALGAQMRDFGVAFKNDPAKTFEEDPAGVTLALWGLVKGGGALHGKVQKLRGKEPGARIVTPGITKSTITKIIKGRSPSPDAPLVVTMPGDPAPPAPHFGPTRGIDAPHEGETVGTQAGHRQEPLPGIEQAIRDAESRDLANKQRAIELDRLPIRGQLGSPETHARELSQLNDAALHNQRTLESLIERLRDPKLPTGNWLKDTATRLNEEIAHAEQLIKTETENNGQSSGVGEIIIRNNRQLLETLPEMAKASTRRRKDIARQVVAVKKRGEDLQRQIFNRHVDLNIPHPKSQTEVARLHSEIRDAIREQRNPVEIRRLRDRLDAVQNLGKEDPLESVKRSLDIPNTDLNEYIPQSVHEAPVNAVEVANGVLQDNFHALDGDYAVQGVGNRVMHLIDQAVENLHNDAEGHHFPDNDMRHFDMLEKLRVLARQHFGENWIQNIERLTPQDQLKIRGFMNDVVRAAIDIEKSPRIATMQFHNQRGFRQDTQSFMQRVGVRRAAEAERAQHNAQRRFTAKTDKGIKAVWARNTREAIAALEQAGFKTSEIALSKTQRRRAPDELTVQQAPRGTQLTRDTLTAYRSPIHVEFRDMLQDTPERLPHPEDIVEHLDNFDPVGDRDIFNAFKAEITKRRDIVANAIEAAGDNALRGAQLQRLDMLHSFENALARMDEYEARTWPKPGEVVPFTGPRYHAPEPTEVPPSEPGGQLVVRGTDEQSLKANRDLSQEPPAMTFGDWPAGGKELPAANQDLFKQREHETGHRASEDIGKPIDLGYYSRNTVDRFFQRLRDSLTETQKPIPGTKGMQRRFLHRHYATDEGHARRGHYVQVERILAPLRESARKLGQHELVAATQAHLQGVLPSEMLAFYDKLIAMKEHLLAKENLPKELKQALRERAPSVQVIDDLINTIKDKPEYAPHVEWLQRFRQYIGDEGFLADNLFGDIIGKDWRISKDLKNARQMWQDVINKVGDEIGPEMHTYIGEAKKASHRVDTELADAGMFPRSILDNRRFQRQRMVGAVLGKDIHDPEAIYVGDSAKATPAGRYLFRRVRSIDPNRIMGERAKVWSGSALLSGRINPSFANYYTGLTSAYSKTAALKFQKEILDKYGIKVQPGWETFDGRKYVQWNALNGRPEDIVGIRDLMDILNKNQEERFGTDILAPQHEQNISGKSTEHPGRVIKSANQAAIESGDLYLIPRDVYNKMTKIQTRNQVNNEFLRYMAKGTKLFRFVALALRPGYLVVNSAESAFRTGYFGGVTPAGFVRGIRAGREFKNEVTPPWLSRSTLQRDVLSVQHLGSKEPTFLREKKGDINDALVRWNRAPLLGNVIDVGRWVARGGPGETILLGTSRVENYLRESLILSKQLKVARRHRYKISESRSPRDLMVNTFGKYFKGIDDTMRDLMRDIASDSPKHDEFRGKMDEIVADVTRVLGDFSKHDRAVLSQVFPFWRWMSFITKFVLWESPVHYPARTFLVQQLGQMGYNELSKMGVLPPNIQGAIPVSGITSETDPDGLVDKHLTIMYTQAWNGMSSVPQMLGVDSATGEVSFGSGLIRNLNPFIQAAYASLTLHDPGSQRELKDRFNNPLNHSVTTYGEILAANVLRAFWPLVLDYDYSQMADNSVPLLHQVTKANAQGPLIQPQSSATQKITAILTGVRTRNISLTKLQTKNLIDAATQVSSLYDSLGDGSDTPSAAQQRFDQRFSDSYLRQLQYMSEWVSRYVDPSSNKDWRETALAIADLNGPS